jgi:quercetin dioxygenase-like cupin family protein
MSGKSYETTRIGDLTRPDGWSPIRRELGVSAFGINAWTAAEAGETIIPDHDETPTGHEELYVVVSGRATFTVDDDEIDAPAGALVFLRDPDAKRAAVAAEPATTVVSVGGKPGEAYQPRSWETNAEPCSTTSPVPRRSSARATPRSSISPPGSRSGPISRRTPARTPTSTRFAAILASRRERRLALPATRHRPSRLAIEPHQPVR